MNNLSNERLANIANLKSPNGMIFPPSHAECAAIARELLAFREAAENPVFTLEVRKASYKGLALGNSFGFVTLDSAHDLKEGKYPLFTAPPLPVEFIPKDLDKALRVLGVSLPESEEGFNLQPERWIQRLINRVIRCESELSESPLPVVPDERKAFEQFMEQRFKESMDQRLCKNGDGYYMAWDMNVAWVVWQQRAMLAAAPKPGGANG